jgi:hypothetical protein
MDKVISGQKLKKVRSFLNSMTRFNIALRKIEQVELDYGIVDTMINEMQTRGDRVQRMLWQIIYENRIKKKGIKYYVSNRAK